jgi:hypothetical protein
MRDKSKFNLAEWFIPNLTLPGNPGSNLILVTDIEIQFVFPDESGKLPRIQLRGNIFLRRLSVASFAIDHPSRGQTLEGPPQISGEHQYTYTNTIQRGS